MKPELTRNRALFSVLGNRVFFCPRVKSVKDDSQLHARLFLAVGEKYDITEDLQPYLLKRYRVREGGK